MRTQARKAPSGRELGQDRISERPIDQIRPSPENAKLYRPVDRNDPDVKALAKSIREHGLQEPLMVTRDGWIISGHRRHVAARLAGLKTVTNRSNPAADGRRWRGTVLEGSEL